MATYNLHRFSEPDALKRIAPESLLKLLARHSAFFTKRGVSLPERLNGQELDYQGIVAILMAPDIDTPPELAEELYLIHEMAEPEAAKELLEDLRERGVNFDGEEPTPADIAVKAFLFNRVLLEQKHAEQALMKPRSFEYFQMDRPVPPSFKMPNEKRLKELAEDLDDWFADHKRCRGTRILPFQKGDGVWFLVLHGELFKREGALKNGRYGSVYYWPGKHDVIVYDPAIGEIRINAGSRAEKELYREKFGLHLFGDKDFFPGEEKYTLEPLLRDGDRALACTDVDGIDWIKLKEIQIMRGGSQGRVEIQRAKDLLLSFQEVGRSLPRGRLIKAGFLVKFSSSKVPRTAAIRPPNVAQYTRDADGAHLEEFFRLRGYVIDKAAAKEAREDVGADVVSV